MRFSLLKLINSFSCKSKTLDKIAVFFAKYLAYLMTAFLIALSILEKNIQILVFPIFAGLFARFIINEVVHMFWKRERPSSLKMTNVLITPPRNSSFPSGHASFFFGISFTLLLFNIPLAIISIICSCIMGLSRIFCGVHWSSDILAGVFAGLFSTYITYYLTLLI